MIKDNILYFGYGDIAVGDTLDGHITFRGFKPPTIVGGDVPKDVDWLTDQIKISVNKFSISELNRLKQKEDKRIVIGNYILDFSNFNQESVNVIKRHLITANLAFAC